LRAAYAGPRHALPSGHEFGQLFQPAQSAGGFCQAGLAQARGLRGLRIGLGQIKARDIIQRSKGKCHCGFTFNG
jgi:hypothetical protein